MYAEWLAWLEASPLGEVARNSAWLFMIVNVLHVLGAALVVGGIAVFDLKVLLDREGAAETGRIAIPLAATGLLVQIPTGVTLLAVEARALGVNPAFYAKMLFIAVGLANLAVFHARFGSAMRYAPLPGGARPFAIMSIAAWVLTLVAGRMIAYL
jgi:hypothetical protein